MTKTKDAMTFEEAHERATEARRDLRRHFNERFELQKKVHELKRRVKELANKEAFADAADAASNRDAFQARVNELIELEKTTQAEFAKYRDMAQELLFATPGPAADHTNPVEIEVTRVIVLNPTSFMSDYAIYLDASEVIRLVVGMDCFESEAYHLDEWVADKGLYLKRTCAKVTL